MTEHKKPEPWLRGTLTDVPAVHRAVIHALQLAEEDLTRWCAKLTPQQINARPGGLAPVAFHLRHIARSIDRLLSYAEGRPLNETQMAALECEMDATAERPEELFAEAHLAFERGTERILALARTDLESHRTVGRAELPARLGGLLVHVADHTQRHVGQAITTAKLVRSEQSPSDRV